MVTRKFNGLSSSCSPAIGFCCALGSPDGTAETIPVNRICYGNKLWWQSWSSV
jgi:hypothetical protein